MFIADKDNIWKILLQLEDRGFPKEMSSYTFLREGDSPRLLGTGGTSCVYEMNDSLSDKSYAVKVILEESYYSDIDRDREILRAQHMFSEQSDNIARVIDFWVFKVFMDEDGNVARVFDEKEPGFFEDGGLILRMLLMEKLESIIYRDKFGKAQILREALDDETGVCDFAVQVGRALSIVHENGFLHRDIKLENIFWDNAAVAYKLGDFGVTRYVENGSADTVVFTDGYGAPEIERRLQTSYNVTADIYSFGITLYLLLNELKFPGSDSYRANIVQYEKDFVFPAPAHASPEMVRIIRRMCSYRYSDRYQSVREVLIDIENLRHGCGHDTDNISDEDVPGDVGDFETETYRDDKGETEGRAQEGGEPDGGFHKTPSDERESSTSWQDLTYEEKKKTMIRQKRDYNMGIVVWMLISAVIFAGIFLVFSPTPPYVGSWQLMVLPVMLIVLAILKWVRQLRIVFGMATVCFLVCFMAVFGVDVPLVIMLFVVVACDPVITAGCGIGAACWIFCVTSVVT